MKSGMRQNRNHLRFENHFRSVVYAAGLAAGTSCCCGITCATSECCSCSCQRKERKQRRCRCCGLLKYSCSYFHFDNCKLPIANCQLSITERQMFFKQQKYLSFLVVSLEVVSWRGYGCRRFRFRHWLFILYWSVQFYLFFFGFFFVFLSSYYFLHCIKMHCATVGRLCYSLVRQFGFVVRLPGTHFRFLWQPNEKWQNDELFKYRKAISLKHTVRYCIR